MSEVLLPWYAYPFFFLVAFLYSSVGHGGASGYLALFALLGVASPAIAPVALILNILVASASFLRYRASGYFSFRMLLPFILVSVPAAFMGGSISIPQWTFSLLLGVALAGSAARILLLGSGGNTTAHPGESVRWIAGLILGSVLGFLSGITGIGGGVFLSPILLLTGWADVKQTAALSSAFIVVNSISGLAGHLTRTAPDLGIIVPLALTVVAGGAIGSYTGAVRLPPRKLQLVLAVVLLTAAAKLLGKVL